MRVVVLTWQYPPSHAGGTEIAAQNLAKHLARRGHQVEVIATRDAGLPAVQVEDMVVVRRVTSLTPRLLKYLWFCLQVVHIVRRTKPDVIHVQSLYAGLPALVCRVCFAVPWMVVGQGSDVYYPGRFGGCLSRLAIRNADVVVALTDDMKRAMARMRDRRITVIPNGVDLDEFADLKKNDCRRELNIELGAKVVVFIGSLVPVKGVGYLLEAMRDIAAQDPGVLLLVVGDGPEENGLRESAREYGVASSVRFCGRVPHDTVAYYLAAADVFALPSLSEGLPNVVLEAMAVGVPVVCSNVTGIRDLIRDGVNGLLVEPCRPRELADCVMRTLSSGALSDGMSRAARETVCRYEWVQVAGQLEAEYLKMLASLPARPG